MSRGRLTAPAIRDLPTGWAPFSRERKELAAAIALSTLASLAAPALLALSGYLLARAAEAPPILTLTTAIVGVRLFALLRAAARYGERVVAHDLALRRLSRDRVEVFSRLIPLVPNIIGARRSTALLDGLVADTERRQDHTVRVIVPGIAIAIATLLATATAAALLPAAAATIALVVGVQVVALALVDGVAGRRLATDHATARERLVGDVATVLDAAPELVAWGAADECARRVADRGRMLDRLVRRAAARLSAGDAITTSAAGIAAAVVLIIATQARDQATIAPALVPALALLAFGVVESVGGLSEVFAHRRDARVADARLEMLLRHDAPPVESESLPSDTRLELRGVSVDRGGRRLVEDVDLEIAPGERVALVGPSGAGKSTLAQVVCGLITPDAGTVTIGGVVVAGLTDEERSSLVCWVPQDPYVFPTTLAGNLRIAAPFASERELEAALRTVGGGDWLDRLPDGLLTLLGEHGERCSGGERQRVGLARAVLSTAPILVLDEPASHLPHDDAIAALRGALAATSNRSALIVTHRAAECGLGDRTVVLSHP